MWKAGKEFFDHAQIICAIEQFLKYGENSLGKGHKGYFSGDGWAARALRFHLESLQEKVGKGETNGNSDS